MANADRIRAIKQVDTQYCVYCVCNNERLIYFPSQVDRYGDPDLCFFSPQADIGLHCETIALPV